MKKIEIHKINDTLFKYDISENGQSNIVYDNSMTLFISNNVMSVKYGISDGITNYNISEVSVYDQTDQGTEEVFSGFDTLASRLNQLNHLSFSNIVISDSGSGGGSNPPDSDETHVFSIVGQSNALPTTNSVTEEFPNGTLQFGDTGIEPATTPLDFTLPSSGSGWMNRFASEYVTANPNVTLVFVQCAVSGSGYFNGFWDVGGGGYNQFISRTNSALSADNSYIFKGVLYHMGETDANEGFDFKDNLAGLINGFRTEITGADSTSPIVVGGLANSFVGSNTNRLEAQAILENLPNVVLYSAFASSVSPTILNTSDGIHFSVGESLTFGDRYYQSYLDALSNDTLASIAEVGAQGHWLFGQDYPTFEDLINQTALTPSGTLPTVNQNNIVTAFGTQGLQAPFSEPLSLTYCVVFNKGNTSGRFQFGTLTTTDGGLGGFTSGNLLYVNASSNPHGLRSVDISIFAESDILFLAYTLDSNGDNAIFIGDTAGTNIYSTNSGGTRTLPSHGRNVSLGNSYYNSGSFGNPLTAYEFIFYNTVKTQTELEEIYARSISRMSSRGVTIK